MQYLILGICVLIGGILLARGFVNSDPKLMARVLRRGGTVVLVVLFVYLALSGRLGVALSMLFLGLPFFMRWRAMTNRMRAARGPEPGQSSILDTEFLHVELDHDTGEMDGEIKQGRYAGRRLGALDIDELIDLVDQCRAQEPQSAAVIEAYLDRTHGPDWRDRAGGRERSREGRPADDGGMSREEAYRILGLQPGADDQAVKEAHRRLMKQFHPDRGGSDYIAAKLNQAKDLLLGP